MSSSACLAAIPVFTRPMCWHATMLSSSISAHMSYSSTSNMKGLFNTFNPMAAYPATQFRRSPGRRIVLVGGVTMALVLLSLVAGIFAGSGRGTLTMLFIAAPAVILGLAITIRRYEMVVLGL